MTVEKIMFSLFSLALIAQNNPFGQIAKTPGINQFALIAGGGQIGLLVFVSALIKLLVVVAGIWSMFNLILAGFKYITAANDAKAVDTALQRIYMNFICMIII